MDEGVSGRGCVSGWGVEGISCECGKNASMGCESDIVAKPIMTNG